MANHTIKITIGRRFFLHQTNSKEFYSYCSISWNSVQYFPKLKNPDGSNVIGEDGRPRRSQKKPKMDKCLTHFGTGDREVVFDGR